jgi:hypothetical protein
VTIVVFVSQLSCLYHNCHVCVTNVIHFITIVYISHFPGWLSASWQPFQRSGHMKCAHWHRLLMHGRRYLFEGIVPTTGNLWNTWMKVTDVMAALVDMVSDATDSKAEEAESRAEMDALRLQVAEALSDFERDVPKTEHASVVHAMLHLPECIWRWNNLRNFWCYAAERYILFNNCHIIISFLPQLSHSPHNCHFSL